MRGWFPPSPPSGMLQCCRRTSRLPKRTPNGTDASRSSWRTTDRRRPPSPLPRTLKSPRSARTSTRRGSTGTGCARHWLTPSVVIPGRSRGCVKTWTPPGTRHPNLRRVWRPQKVTHGAALISSPGSGRHSSTKRSPSSPCWRKHVRRYAPGRKSSQNKSSC